MEEFRDKLNLPVVKVNLYKHSQDYGIKDSKIIAVFGQKRPGKSGYPIKDVTNPKLKRAIDKYYRVCYTKPLGNTTNVIDKDFAIAIVADVLKGTAVNWTAFAAMMNFHQRNMWRKNMVTLVNAKVSGSQRGHLLFRSATIGGGKRSDLCFIGELSL